MNLDIICKNVNVNYSDLNSLYSYTIYIITTQAKKVSHLKRGVNTKGGIMHVFPRSAVFLLFKQKNVIFNLPVYGDLATWSFFVTFQR